MGTILCFPMIYTRRHMLRSSACTVVHRNFDILHSKFTFNVNIACSVNDCAVVQYSSGAVYTVVKRRKKIVRPSLALKFKHYKFASMPTGA